MKELPTVVITTLPTRNGDNLRALPKATAYAYRNRTFQRVYKRGVRQAAAALLGCAVKDVQHNAPRAIYYCQESKAVHEQDMGVPATPKQRRRRG